MIARVLTVTHIVRTARVMAVLHIVRTVRTLAVIFQDFGLVQVKRMDDKLVIF